MLEKTGEFGDVFVKVLKDLLPMNWIPEITIEEMQ
jgi:hypothetical protein